MITIFELRLNHQPVIIPTQILRVFVYVTNIPSKNFFAVHYKSFYEYSKYFIMKPFTNTFTFKLYFYLNVQFVSFQSFAKRVLLSKKVSINNNKGYFNI